MDPGRRPADRGQPAAACLGFLSDGWPVSRWWRKGQIGRQNTRDRLLPGPPPCCATLPVDHRIAGKVFGPVLSAMSWDEDHAVSWPTPPSLAWWPVSGRATADASCAWQARQERPGLHQQPRRRRWRGAAVRRRQVIRATAARRLRGAVRLYHREDGGDQARITTGAVNTRVKGQIHHRHRLRWRHRRKHRQTPGRARGQGHRERHQHGAGRERSWPTSRQRAAQPRSSPPT